jgi:hypothetical protein
VVAFRPATFVASLMGLAAAFVAARPLLATAPAARPTAAKVHSVQADLAWDTTTRKGLTRAQIELEVAEEGYPLIGLEAVPSVVQWDGSAVHPSLLTEAEGKPGQRYLKVKVAPGARHELRLEYETPLESIEAVPVSAETHAVPLLIRFDEPSVPHHQLKTNGVAHGAGEGKWSVSFKESTTGLYLALPEKARQGEDPRLKKLVRWFLRLPFALFGGGGEGPPPLVTFKPRK